MDYIQKIYILKIYMYIVYIQYVYKLEGTADFCIRGDNTLVLFVFNLNLVFSSFFSIYVRMYVNTRMYVCKCSIYSYRKNNTKHSSPCTTDYDDDDDGLLHNGITTTVNYDRRQQNIGTE